MGRKVKMHIGGFEGYLQNKRQKQYRRNSFYQQSTECPKCLSCSRHNIIRGTVGLKNAASKAKTEIDHFLLFITHEILADVLHHTNKKIDSLLAKLPADFNKAFKYSFVKEVSEMELKAFIGLLLYHGLYKLNTMGIRKLFSDSYGPPMFNTVISRNRFAFILHNLSFDDERTRVERWKKGRFTAIR